MTTDAYDECHDARDHSWWNWSDFHFTGIYGAYIEGPSDFSPAFNRGWC